MAESLWSGLPNVTQILQERADRFVYDRRKRLLRHGIADLKVLRHLPNGGSPVV